MIAETKGHTPGPLTTRLSVDSPDKDIGICDAGGGLIAEVYERPGPTYEVLAPVEANAALFRAAPETAAERDRLLRTIKTLSKVGLEIAHERDWLREVNAALVTALKALSSYPAVVNVLEPPESLGSLLNMAGIAIALATEGS